MIRFFDLIFSSLGLILLSPLLIIVYIFIIFDSKGGGFYLQKRVGKNNQDFNLIKFRTMRLGSDQKGLITVGGRDHRITKVGLFIRHHKIDELPQLINVLKGDMSIVGPRPEVRKYVDLYDDIQKKILSIRPGITDYASIAYVNENIILGKVIDPEKVYIEEIIPNKIKLNLRYLNNLCLSEYFKIIFLTIFRTYKF